LARRWASTLSDSGQWHNSKGFFSKISTLAPDLLLEKGDNVVNTQSVGAYAGGNPMNLHELQDKLDFLENCGVAAADLEALFARESADLFSSTSPPACPPTKSAAKPRHRQSPHSAEGAAKASVSNHRGRRDGKSESFLAAARPTVKPPA
jgi:hypothetical protein